MKLLAKKETKHAFYIGAISALAYFMCYFGRNILSVVSPQIVANTKISLTFIGTMSTSNMVCYAVGQLINGIIGDKVKGKYLVSMGLVLAGLCNIIISVTELKIILLLAYSAIGFFFSMLYAPLVKMIAENTHPKHAMRCCLGLSFGSLLGAPFAGMMAIFFEWYQLFWVCGLFLIATGLFFFITVARLEKLNVVKYVNKEKESRGKGGVRILVRHSIIKFSGVAILTGIVRTSVVFWVPTYLSQYLGFSTADAALAFTALTCAQTIAPYVNNLLIFEYVLKRNMNRMLLLSFGASTSCFVLMFVVKQPLINMVFLLFALMGSTGASEMIWAVYCPSLRKTGMVSTATGYLDALSYGAAAVANILFANAISAIGWDNLILVWSAIMGLGVIISIPWKKRLNS